MLPPRGCPAVSCQIRRGKMLSMSLKPKDFLDAAVDALAEAEAGALASIGKRGTYAKQQARRAGRERLARRWAAICAATKPTHEAVEPVELSRAFYLSTPPRPAGVEGGGVQVVDSTEG